MEWYQKDPIFKIGNQVRISKYIKQIAKGYVPNYFEEGFVIKNVKNTVAWTYVCSDLKGENLLERFIKKNCKRPIKENLG